ncbi:MAG: hypothetical protein IKY82_08040 [Alistipes sp.]|nr:hypothetical protein [Alistipes sp.]
MSLGRVALFVVVAVALAVATVNDCAAQRVAVTFFNVENLFDVENDPATADEDMLPLSDRAWTVERYEAKLAGLARTIVDLAEDGELPTIVGLAEVENQRVIDDLLSQDALQGAAYEVCHFDSDDARGIDVALLYRSDLFSCEGCRVVKMRVDDAPNLRTRDMLMVWGSLGERRVAFCVVHWPSRIGGSQQTEHLRMGCAECVRQSVDSLMSANPDLGVVVMGDMNDNPTDKSIRKVLGARRAGRRVESARLYTLHRGRKGGTSVYDGRWNRYDNILLSGNLLHSAEGDVRARQSYCVEPLRKAYLLDEKGHPRPTYRGSDYEGGVSDHLPIKVVIYY